MTLAGTALADAVDTQTEAILIRAMSAGVAVRSVFVRELATGAVPWQSGLIEDIHFA